MMTTYRITVQEVVNGELGKLIDIVEVETEPLPSGQNVFHLCRRIETAILKESESVS